MTTHHEQTYARLVSEYVSSLEGKIGVLDRALAQAPSDATALAQARDVAHRMRGTAGCYGFRELSDAAGLLDESLTALQRGQGSSWDEAVAFAEQVRSVAQATIARRS